MRDTTDKTTSPSPAGRKHRDEGHNRQGNFTLSLRERAGVRATTDKPLSG